jgi:predicted metal-dependent enzyme (double-stranded beta helix superfamily)
VVVLAPDTIHSVANRGRNHSRAIHVYLEPLTQIARSVWTADGNRGAAFE